MKTEKQIRCSHCAYLVEGMLGNWMCDCDGKNIEDIHDDDCPCGNDDPIIYDDGVGKMGGEFHKVRCCKCGYQLIEGLDSCRFTADGKPICYECVALGKDEN